MKGSMPDNQSKVTQVTHSYLSSSEMVLVWFIRQCGLWPQHISTKNLIGIGYCAVYSTTKYTVLYRSKIIVVRLRM